MYVVQLVALEPAHPESRLDHEPLRQKRRRLRVQFGRWFLSDRSFHFFANTNPRAIPDKMMNNEEVVMLAP